MRIAPWVVVAHSNLFSLGGATSGECFAAGERVLGSPTTCLLLPLYIRFYRLAAPCRVVSLPRGFSYVLSLSVVGILVVLFFSTLCLYMKYGYTEFGFGGWTDSENQLSD